MNSPEPFLIILNSVPEIKNREFFSGIRLDYKESVLQDLQNTVGSHNASPENRADTTTRLLETKIYTIKRNTLTGFFTVFVVDLDFSVILDGPTRTAIRGYIGDTKTS